MKTRKILPVSLLLLCCLPYRFAMAEMSPMFVSIRSTSAELTINGSTANCYGGVTAYLYRSG